MPRKTIENHSRLWLPTSEVLFSQRLSHWQQWQEGVGGSSGPLTPTFRKTPRDPTLMVGDFCCCCFSAFWPKQKKHVQKVCQKDLFFWNRRSALGFSLFYFYWWYSIRDTCIKLQQASQHAARRIATAITSTVRLVLPPDFEISWNDVLGVKERYTRTHRINVW